MDETTTKKNPARDTDLTRRDFLNALGISAAAGVLAADSALGQSALPVYQDSFGNIAPAAGDALSAGVYPPPVYSGGPGPSVPTPGYAQPNILMIMVDQLRSPRWLPPGGQAAVDQLLPNIAFLRDHSFNFPNYFVAATNCTPSRASLLTGLYTQQTFLMNTQVSASHPSLQPGFTTFGAALAQQANYATCWMGKWHLSDFVPQSSGPGSNGPGDYGFTAGSLNSPKDASLASPNGFVNEGCDGYNNSPYGSGTPTPAAVLPQLQTPFPMLNDAAIANWFINKWLPNAPSSQPWFAAVSLINPHDIADFPCGFGLAGTPNFGAATSPSPYGYQPPPPTGSPFNPAQPDQYIPPLNASLYPQSGSLPAQWSGGDDPLSQPYGVKNANGWGKPGLQASFSARVNYADGPVQNAAGWMTFLNYYFWLQSCVDYHIGRVLNSLNASSFASSTIIMFTSDHGDYGGSHNLHTKGGALYDESINVPLYISFPRMRPPFAPAITGRIRPFVCSSVDIFPLLYTLALGNSAWRNNPADPYNYLSGRECILDAILSTAPQQRRLSPFPNSNGVGYQPYILHTTDEYPTATIPGTTTAQPSHAIAYRTVDTTVTTAAGGSTFYGGAKLGMYSYWPCGATTPDPAKPQQFEFYNYTAGNFGEIGNSALTSPTQLDALPTQYLSAYNSAAPTELYVQYSQVQSAAQTAKTTYFGFIKTLGGC